MKKDVLLIGLLFLLGFIHLPAQGSTLRKADTLWIKTSAQCEICKETIEKALAYERGIIFSELDLKTKEVKVIFNPDKTTPEKIRQAISNAGYDADDVRANPKAYQRLPRCCKKPQDR
ncbi:MAG: heavy-metal-associated domain-containing protein [Bacteroidales bacterium]